MDIKSFESYDVSGDYYNLKDKLGLYVLNRSKECFERAEKKRAEIKTNEELNEEVIAFMIKKKVLTKESAKKLVEQNKIHINDTSVLE